jgi:threonine/homoserine/homoserine lactone efflux protein
MGILEGILYMIWRGIAIGIIISAPMGPVGILCLQRTLERGRRVGFLTGVGAALSDLFYCLLTGFGLSFIEGFIKSNQDAIQIIGSVVLVGFGVYIFQSNPSRNLKKPDDARTSGKKNILSGFLFTFSNPLIIFLIIGLFARFNFLLPEIHYYHYVIGFLMIIVGALSWWWVITFFVDKVRTHFNLRSMWLINKITGSIIMIFGIVGVITAMGGIMHAGNRSATYLNSTRGFGNGEPVGETLTIANNTADTLYRSIPLQSEDLCIEARIRAVNNAERKSYKYTDQEGKTRKVSHPTWGFYLQSGEVRGERSLISFKTEESRDDIRDSKVMLTANEENFDAKGLNPYDGWNAFRIEIADGDVRLTGGEKTYDKLVDFILPEATDSIGVFIAPGGKLELDYIAITDRGPENRDTGYTATGKRDSYTGVWQILDLSLNEDMLAKGGDYRLQMIATDRGYALLYLDGAEYNKGDWKEGDLKAELTESGIKGIYDVIWYDAAGRALAERGKCQFEDNRLLTITFPRYEGSARLIKLKIEN